MTDAQRFQHLLDHRASLTYSDTFTINRVNYDFLLNSRNKYLKLKGEFEAIKKRLAELEVVES